jgi:hypothetical protein
MLTALIALLSAIIGVLLAGGMQLAIAARERKVESRRSARLLFADWLHSLDAVEFLLEHEAWWSDKMAPPLDGWLNHRPMFAGAMDGLAFIDVDAAFYRVAALERSRALGVRPTDAQDDAREAYEMLSNAGGALLLEGFDRDERTRMERAMKDALSVVTDASDRRTEVGEVSQPPS